MKYYDYDTAKRMIQLKSDVLESASLGMEEDWFWTGQTVYEDGKFVEELIQGETEIAGIGGSNWATPAIHLVYKDGREEMLDCYTGDSDCEKPEWFSLGILSSPGQEWVDSVKRPKLSFEE